MSVTSTEIKENKESKEKKETTENQAIPCSWTKNTDTFLLLNIPLGKPDRKNPGKQTKQPGQKRKTCVYYAFQISTRLKKDYLERQKQQDRKLASEYRKNITLIGLHEQFAFGCIQDITQKASTVPFSKMDKKTRIEFYISKLSEVNYESIRKTLGVTSSDETIKQCATDFLNENLASQKFMKEFVEERNLKKRIGACLTFLRNLDLDPLEVCRKEDELRKKTFLNLYTKQVENDLDTVPLIPKSRLLFNAEFNLMGKICDTKPLQWSPSQGFDALFKHFKETMRPIIVRGQFGVPFYKEKPKELSSTLDNYKVFGFAPGTHDDYDHNAIPHAITVIGIEKNPITNSDKKGWIYYVDPDDECDPTLSHAKRTIYKISFEQFCTFLINNAGLVYHINNRQSGKREPIHLKQGEYGYY